VFEHSLGQVLGQNLGAAEVDNDIDAAAIASIGLAAPGLNVAGALELDQAVERLNIAAHLLFSGRAAGLRISCCDAQETAEHKQGLEMHFGMG
ncbi:hypothetical protein BGX29_003639, partial [Mortierella sp. GBA35]